MPVVSLTAVLWLVFVLLFAAAAYLCLPACDLGVGPLFGLHYCSAAAAETDLDHERQRQSELVETLYAKQLRVAEAQLCTPLAPMKKAELPSPPPAPVAPPQEPPKEEMKIPKTLAELAGCWQSERGDIEIVTDDEAQTPQGNVRICYCFSPAGRGTVSYRYTDGQKCHAAIKVKLSAQALGIDQPNMNCGPKGNIVPAHIDCSGAVGLAADCDTKSLGKMQTKTIGEKYVRVEPNYCN